jgi:steroid delta-isomerase-like uncharacterized protein
MTMSIEQNKALYRRFLQEVFSDGRLDRLGKFLAPDYVFRDAPPGSPPGAEAIRQVVAMFRGAFPDLTIAVEAIVAEGDLVCVRATTRGTHQGAFFNIPPTGKAVAMAGMTMVRIADGKIAESWVKNDVAGLMRQIGVGDGR